jgi:hypothetical protein
LILLTKCSVGYNKDIADIITKTMNRFFNFKLTFLSMSAGLFIASLVYGLFDIDFSNTEAITKLVLKSFVTATVTGLILGIMNMFLKIGNFKK